MTPGVTFESLVRYFHYFEVLGPPPASQLWRYLAIARLDVLHGRATEVAHMLLLSYRGHFKGG